MTVIVDTNVILVANRQHDDASEDCVVACALTLQNVMRDGRIALDEGFLILQEYQKKTTPNRARGPGDAFVKWALQNHANEKRCDQITITRHEERRFEQFPDDARLGCFDDADRKFVAVASAHPGHPPIVEATDSKWLDWQAALRDHGITIDFICPDDIQRYHIAKFGR